MSLMGKMFFLGLIYLFALCYAPFTYAASSHFVSDPPEPILVEEGTGSITLDPHAQILEDPTGKLTLNEILKSSNIEFKYDKGQALNFGYTESSYWIRFSLFNPGNEKKERYVWLNNSILDFIHFYVVDENNFPKKAILTGLSASNESKDVNDTLYGFRLHLPPESTRTVYMRFASDGPLIIPLKLYDFASIVDNKFKRKLLLGLIYGALFIMMVYNLLLYFRLRQLSYLFYVLSNLSLTLFLASTEGVATMFLWPGAPVISKYLAALMPCFILPALLYFSKHFLSIDSSHSPRLVKWINGFSIFCLVYAALFFFIHMKILIPPQNLLVVVGLTILIGAGVSSWRRGYRAARLYLISWMGFFIGALFFVFIDLGWMAYNMLAHFSFHLGIVFQLSMLALALADKILIIQQEKESAQAESIRLKKEAIDNLMKADRIKDMFLANTSHELRTPLHGIMGLTESLLREAKDEWGEWYKSNLNLIHMSAKRLTSLVNDILDFSKMKEQEIQLDLSNVDLHQLMESMLPLLQTLIKGKQVQLKNEIPQDLSLVRADVSRLHQILLNLLGNAIKFTDQGEVTVRAHKDSAGLIRIEIEDSGVGIESDDLAGIFNAFEQIDADSNRKYGGTGLGLSITKQLVELHGGSIEVESTVGKGSLFTFSLPVPTEEESKQEKSVKKDLIKQTEQKAHAPISFMDTSENKNLTILLVDDEMINLQVLWNHLSHSNFHLVGKESGIAALDYIQNNDPVDLVLLDVMMPLMDGFEVCEKLRMKFNPTDLPIIMLTAKNMDEDIIRGLSLGANDYITKPFSRDVLMARIETQLVISQLAQKLVRLNANLENLVLERTKKLEEEMEVRKVAENKREEMRVQAMQSAHLASIGTLASGVAHELNNPLVTVLGQAKLIQSKTEEVETNDYILRARKIVEAADRMQRIIAHLQQLAVKTGNESMGGESLSEILEGVLLLFKTLLEKNNIKVLLELHNDLPNISAERAKLENALHNIIANSIDAFQLGPERDDGFILIKTDQVDQMVTLLIRDNGGGIDLEHKERVLEPFFTTKNELGRSGLGLALVKATIDQHKAFLRIESEGDETSVLLSFNQFDEERLPIEIPKVASILPRPLSGKPRLLLIDDEEDIIELLVEVIEGKFDTLGCSQPIQAMNLIRNETFDLILTDFKMPGKTGLDMIKLSKVHQPETPIVLMTAFAIGSKEVNQAKELGVKYILNKPFTSHETIVDELMAQL